MQLRTLAIILTLTALGCKSTPKGVLSEEKMIEVLTEIHIAEGRLKTVNIFSDSAKKMAPVLYHQIYQEQQVTAEEFKKSYDYYQQNPKQFEAMIDKVIIELSKKESGIK
jgi:hypothetical protein